MADPAPTPGHIYQYVIVPDATDAEPKFVKANTLDEMLKLLYNDLVDARCGKVFATIDGEPCKLSIPCQVFVLQLPDGSTRNMMMWEGSTASPSVFPENNVFRTLTDMG